nr:GNAT family N-acetyltransferase [Saccharopolyspora erythraea]
MVDRIRRAEEDDHARIVEAIGTWWSDSRSPQAARELSMLVPRLFLQHFAGTSLVIERDGGFLGFLVGFVSQDHPEQAYVHFVGVDPAQRRGGVARRLYETFFDTVRRAGCTTVKCITSPVNTGSVGFHRRMGFSLVPGDDEVDGLPVHSDYDGLGQDRVCFVRELA